LTNYETFSLSSIFKMKSLQTLFFKLPLTKIHPILSHNLIRGLSFCFLFFASQSKAMTADTVSKIKVDSIKYFITTANFGLTFNQLSLTNWASGGESSISGKANVDYKLRYQKEGSSAELIHKSAFGIVGYGAERIEKTEDRLDFSVSYSQKAFKEWTYTSLFTFKSQFANGYKYPNDSTLVSAFLAPGYLTASLGFKYRKSEKFELFISPASGKFTFVKNQDLADKGAFGVEKAILDSSGAVLVPGKNLLSEFGFNILAIFNKELSKNIDLASSLNLYNNYMDEDRNNRWNIDVDWETKVNFTVNKRIHTVLFLLLKYDHDTDIPVYDIIEGQKNQIGSGPRLQVKESLGIGFSYKIG